MFYFKLFFLLYFLPTFLITQLYAEKYDNFISGYVTDDSTLEAVENANVYISNTTFGSSTDKDGYYIIKSIPPNIHELIITTVGYKTVEFQINIQKDSKIKKNFKLTPVVYEAQAIDITSTTPDQWLKNLEIFKDIFLGKTFRAEKCIIENPEILEFNEAIAVLKATSQNPLIIKNDVLGFKVYCGALSFSYNMGRNSWSWSIKPRFEELIVKDSIQAKLWQINRQIAYFGSMYHFFMSLKQNKLSDDGYRIFITDKNTKSSANNQYTFLADLNSILIPAIYEKYHLITFDKFLLVKNYSIEDHFTDINNLDIEFGDTFQESFLNLLYGQMTLDEYGYPVEDKAFKVNGYWATLGVADLLPRYFELKKD
jgi:hypothetical protein